MNTLKEAELGLVLSGGGAKGAYQVGFFEAMERYGMFSRLTAIAGSSIGAVNALLCASRDCAVPKAAWDAMTLEDVAVAAQGGGAGQPGDYYPDTESRFSGMTLMQYLAAASPFPYSQEGLRRAVERFLPLPADGPRLHCCAYNMELLRPEYFCLNDLSPADAAQLILASCCIPILFPPVEYGGRSYCDGGLLPPYFRGVDNSDKIPLSPLADFTGDLIVVLYLSCHDALDFSELRGGCPVLEVYPSAPLEKEPGSGTLDFSPEAKAHHMALGREDGCKLLEKLSVLLDAGVPLPEAAGRLNRESQKARLELIGQ